MSLTAFLALAALAVGTCEPARFAGPVAALGSAKSDARLAGVWSGHSASGETLFLHVVPHGTEMDLVLVGTDAPGAMVLHYQGHAASFGNLNLLGLRSKRFPDPLREKFELSADWIWVKYALGSDGALQLSWVTSEGMSKAIAIGALKGSLTKAGVARVSDSPTKIVTYLASATDTNLWSAFEPLRRLPTP